MRAQASQALSRMRVAVHRVDVHAYAARSAPVHAQVPPIPTIRAFLSTFSSSVNYFSLSSISQSMTNGPLNLVIKYRYHLQITAAKTSKTRSVTQQRLNYFRWPLDPSLVFLRSKNELINFSVHAFFHQSSRFSTERGETTKSSEQQRYVLSILIRQLKCRRRDQPR